MIEIKHRYTSAVLVSVEAACLRGANLGGANLGGADLGDADLGGADLGGADLRGADLRDADLRGADLGGADLGGADLRGADLNWQSHDLLSEILRQAAGDDPTKRAVAGLILVSRDWCWPQFVALAIPGREWALDTLAGYVREGDGAPEILRTWQSKS
jgi:hypothetical protein